MVKPVSLEKPKVPELVAFGAAVRRRRTELGYSQEGFGDACGIDRSYMGGIERGEHNLALVNILKIVQALGVQPSDFFKDLDKPAKKGKPAMHLLQEAQLPSHQKNPDNAEK